ncbi:class B sortase, partial [uncultured Catenibacterium sp.]|uniref:class B sortase n=1 Tax=uncultured Catenibacterium sp. TaxID=286142 RepID=UPI0025EFBB6B
LKSIDIINVLSDLVSEKMKTTVKLPLDEDNDASMTDSNTIIYGHNMKNGSMFANIKKFTDHDYFINHPEVYIYLPDGSINVYSIYSTKIIDATSDYYLKNIDYASYVNNAKSSAKQSRDVDTQNTAPLLLLSTCYAPDTPTRSVLFARLEKNVK